MFFCLCVHRLFTSEARKTKLTAGAKIFGPTEKYIPLIKVHHFDEIALTENHSTHLVGLTIVIGYLLCLFLAN